MIDPDFEKVLFIGGPLHGTFHFLHKCIKSLSAVNDLSPYLVGGSKCQYYRQILVSPQKTMYIDKLVRLAVTLEMIHNGTADYGEETKGYALELATQIADQIRQLKRKSERIGR